GVVPAAPRAHAQARRGRGAAAARAGRGGGRGAGARRARARGRRQRRAAGSADGESLRSGPVTAFSWILLLPLYILAALLLVLGTFALLGRIKGGKYLRPVVGAISKVPLFRLGLQKASTAALERQNPDLAS